MVAALGGASGAGHHTGSDDAARADKSQAPDEEGGPERHYREWLTEVADWQLYLQQPAHAVIN